jgi:uncharacterized protein involved in outer membrane biogenesis
MRWLRRGAWGLAALVLLMVAAWLAVPALLKWQVPLRASEALGRPVTLGGASFRPWSLELTLRDLTVAGLPQAKAPLLQVAQVHANLSAASIFKRAPVIEALELDGLRLNLARTGEGHYDIDDLIARFTPAPDAKPAGEPTRFALYNLQVRDAQLRFDDRPVGRVQQLEALTLTLPFVSNLPAEVDIKVEPRLAFKLNGTPFDSGAQSTPFAQTRTGDIKLAFADLDLAPYLGYLPATLPVRLAAGRISADLALRFALPPSGAPTLALKGTLGAKQVSVRDASGAPLLGWATLALGLRDVQPLARRLALETLTVTGLQLDARRGADGAINLLRLAPAGSAVATSPPKGSAEMPASAASARSAAAPNAWQASLESLALTGARVLWNDGAVKPAVALQLDGLAIAAKQLQWALARPVPVTLKGMLRSQAPGAPGGPVLAEFSADGLVTDHDARLGLRLAGISLAAFSPYLSQSLVPTLAGQLAAQAQLDWSGAADAPRLALTVDSLALDDLRVHEPGAAKNVDAVALKQLALTDVKLDLLTRTVAVGQLKLVQPTVQIARDSAGRLNVQGWVPGSDKPASKAKAAPAAPTAPAWNLQLKDFALESGQLRLVDAVARPGTREPVRLELSNVSLALQGLAWQGEKPQPPATIRLSARLGTPGRERQRAPGSIDYKGRVGMQPLMAAGNLKIERLPVHLFAPYFADKVQLSLLRAEAGYTGNLNLRALPAGLDLSAAGDMRLGDVHIASLPEPGSAATLANTDELLSWQLLALKRVKVAMKPRARPQVEIGEAALTDFYSRLVITEQGRFNLQDATADRAPAPVPLGGVAPPQARASDDVRTAALDATPASSAVASAPATATAPIAPIAPIAASAPAATELPLDLRIGATQLTNGSVDFTDRFVRPNYSAALTELNGQLGAFSSGSREMATLELRGRAAGTAQLEISGQVNPTAKPLALDIRARATDLELAPLSPYAGKYAGYAIERGKLSMDVAYKIDADGKLDAKNQVVLNQLTFGEKIESKDATKLPVLLAVALLKDRNGVIDINLPVSGSVNDPKFSVGAIIWKVIVNILTKAITAPFSLLAGGGGADDLSSVEFKPGTAQIAAAGVGAIDKVAKALVDKPALKMTVTGAADAASERDAFQAAAVEARLVVEQKREGVRAGEPASAASAASAPPTFGADERARLLKQVYKETDLPNKPRNALGFARDISGPEMEALLKARVPVNDEALRALALQRGIAVRDALLAKGLPSERLFLAAPKLRTAGEDTAPWSPRVQLTLSAN